MSTQSFIDNIILGDNVKAKTDFNSLIHDKTQNSIDGLKNAMAQQIFGEIEQSIETEAEPEVSAEPEVQVEESFDILKELQNASSIKNAEINMLNGEVVPIDFKTADIVLRYVQTLSQEERDYFLEDIVENERGLLKGIEQAFYELGEK